MGKCVHLKKLILVSLEPNLNKIKNEKFDFITKLSNEFAGSSAAKNVHYGRCYNKVTYHFGSSNVKTIGLDKKHQ